MDEHSGRAERSYGAFGRTVRFPATVDGSQVTATFKNGRAFHGDAAEVRHREGTTIPIKAE